MSEESKPEKKTFDFPMMPIFGVDLGERLGSLAEGQKQLRGDFQRLEARFDALDAKTDKMANAIHRLDERMNGLDGRMNGLDGRMNGMEKRLDSLDEGRKTDHRLLIGILAAVVAGLIVQFISK